MPQAAGDDAAAGIEVEDVAPFDRCGDQEHGRTGRVGVGVGVQPHAGCEVHDGRWGGPRGVAERVEQAAGAAPQVVEDVEPGGGQRRRDPHRGAPGRTSTRGGSGHVGHLLLVLRPSDRTVLVRPAPASSSRRLSDRALHPAATVRRLRRGRRPSNGKGRGTPGPSAVAGSRWGARSSSAGFRGGGRRRLQRSRGRPCDVLLWAGGGVPQVRLRRRWPAGPGCRRRCGRGCRRGGRWCAAR